MIDVDGATSASEKDMVNPICYAVFSWTWNWPMSRIVSLTPHCTFPPQYCPRQTNDRTPFRSCARDRQCLSHGTGIIQLCVISVQDKNASLLTISTTPPQFCLGRIYVQSPTWAELCFDSVLDNIVSLTTHFTLPPQYRLGHIHDWTPFARVSGTDIVRGHRCHMPASLVCRMSMELCNSVSYLSRTKTHRY